MSKILVVEDNELNLKLMVDLLVFNNYQVKTAIDGKIALESLKVETFDLILLDIQMPNISGFDVLKKLKEEKNPAKVVVVSACAMEKEINRAKELGCNDFLSKPIRMQEFLECVKKNLT